MNYGWSIVPMTIGTGTNIKSPLIECRYLILTVKASVLYLRQAVLLKNVKSQYGRSESLSKDVYLRAYYHPLFLIINPSI